MTDLVWIQQAVVDPQLHQLGEKIKNLSLQGHGSAGGVLLQSLYHQRLEQADVIVNCVLKYTRVKVSDTKHILLNEWVRCKEHQHMYTLSQPPLWKLYDIRQVTLSPRWRVTLVMLDLSWLDTFCMTSNHLQRRKMTKVHKRSLDLTPKKYIAEM